MSTMPGWSGGQVGARAVCVVAPNPGPMTLDGTNTWVLFASDGRLAVVVDPGPAADAHLRRVLDVVESRGARVAEAVLTHGHADHSEGARRFAELAGAPVRAVDPAYQVDGDGLRDGDVVAAGDLELRVVVTPGHTADSVSLLLPAERALLTGDTVLGRGTTVVAHPDGSLGPYLRSLRLLREVVVEEDVRRLLPGHGPVLEEPVRVLDAYLAHRAERLEQVRVALRAGARTPWDVVERVYAEVDPVLWPAAEQSVRAQLDYLETEKKPSP
jgi:glyoxylase-like metal-dependent hydrolase (beta-lactamase superfamily II)